MKRKPLDPNCKQTGAYASNVQTSADIGDLIRVQHKDGLYYAEVIGIEAGDAGEVLFFQYVEPEQDNSSAPLIEIDRPFQR